MTGHPLGARGARLYRGRQKLSHLGDPGAPASFGPAAMSHSVWPWLIPT